MVNSINAAILIIAMSGVTILLRFLPFIIFKGDKEIPSLIIYLGDILPAAAIGMLVVYCLREINIMVYPFGLFELLASLVVVIVQLYKRNSVISILLGTLTYIVLLNVM